MVLPKRPATGGSAHADAPTPGAGSQDTYYEEYPAAPMPQGELAAEGIPEGQIADMKSVAPMDPASQEDTMKVDPMAADPEPPHGD
eukprot:14855235-Alexandrium_andersonii.AAC.1